MYDVNFRIDDIDEIVAFSGLFNGAEQAKLVAKQAEQVEQAKRVAKLAEEPTQVGTELLSVNGETEEELVNGEGEEKPKAVKWCPIQ